MPAYRAVMPRGRHAMQPAAEDAEHDPDHGAKRRLADELSGLAAGVPAGRGEDQEEEHERKREPVVEPGLEVERVADRLRDRARRDHRGGDHGVGGAEDRAEQEGLGPGEVAEQQLRAAGEQDEGDRHRDHEGAGGRAPVAGEELAIDQQPVGDQGQDQRQLDQLDDPLVADVDRDDVQFREHDPQHDREHGGREHGAADQPRERRGHGQQPAEDQRRLAEREVHQRTYQST